MRHKTRFWMCRQGVIQFERKYYTDTGRVLSSPLYYALSSDSSYFFLGLGPAQYRRCGRADDAGRWAWLGTSSPPEWLIVMLRYLVIHKVFGLTGAKIWPFRYKLGHLGPNSSEYFMNRQVRVPLRPSYTELSRQTNKALSIVGCGALRLIP